MSGETGQSAQRNRSDHWSRHPMLMSAIGILLTGVVGTTITFVYNRLSAEREQVNSRIAARRTAILETHRALFAYQGAAFHLETEIGNTVPREAMLNAFRLYQDAAGRAYAAIPGADYVLYQQVSGSEASGQDVAQSMKDFESAMTDVVDNRLLPLLRSTDACISSRYALAAAGGASAASDDCGDAAALPAAYPRIPHNRVDRLHAYGECAEAFTSIMLAMGTDPDETLWSKHSLDPSFVARIKKTLDLMCPPLGPAKSD